MEWLVVLVGGLFLLPVVLVLVLPGLLGFLALGVWLLYWLVWQPVQFTWLVVRG